MQVPPDQSIVSRSEEKSEGKPGNGSPEPDMIEDIGPVLSFRKIYCCGHWIISNPIGRRGKADVLVITEGSSPLRVMTSVMDTTVVVDQGMYSKG
jgi:hypothetical protein